MNLKYFVLFLGISMIAGDIEVCKLEENVFLIKQDFGNVTTFCKISTSDTHNLEGCSNVKIVPEASKKTSDTSYKFSIECFDNKGKEFPPCSGVFGDENEPKSAFPPVPEPQVKVNEAIESPKFIISCSNSETIKVGERKLILL
jgi:hypothetical protein